MLALARAISPANLTIVRELDFEESPIFFGEVIAEVGNMTGIIAMS